MKPVSSLTTAEDITLVNLRDIPNDLVFFSEVLGVFAAQKINIDMISQSTSFSDKFGVSFTVPGDELEETLTIIAALREKHPNVKLSANGGNAKITIAGEGMRTTFGVAYTAVKAMSDHGIPIQLINTSETEISFLISAAYLYVAQDALKACFDL